MPPKTKEIEAEVVPPPAAPAPAAPAAPAAEAAGTKLAVPAVPFPPPLPGGPRAPPFPPMPFPLMFHPQHGFVQAGANGTMKPVPVGAAVPKKKRKGS